jgi:hypothetical protein
VYNTTVHSKVSYYLPGNTDPETTAQHKARPIHNRVRGVRAKQKTSRMEAISCFALGGAAGGDAVCSFLIPVSCSRGALWVASTVSTSVVSMEGIIHKVFCTYVKGKERRLWIQYGFGTSVRRMHRECQMRLLFSSRFRM